MSPAEQCVHLVNQANEMNKNDPNDILLGAAVMSAIENGVSPEEFQSMAKDMYAMMVSARAVAVETEKTKGPH